MHWLNAHPMYWNTYYYWEGSIEYRLLQHDKDFRVTDDYRQKLLQAARQSIESTRQVASR